MCWQWTVTSASMVDGEQVSGQLKAFVPYVDVLQLSPHALYCQHMLMFYCF